MGATFRTFLYCLAYKTIKQMWLDAYFLIIRGVRLWSISRLHLSTCSRLRKHWVSPSCVGAVTTLLLSPRAVQNVTVSSMHNEFSCSPARWDSALLKTLLSVFSFCSWACRSSGLACLEANNKRNSVLAKRVSSEIPQTHAAKLSVLC